MSAPALVLTLLKPKDLIGHRGRQPESQAMPALVAFLASGRNSYISGTTIGIDGGATQGT